MEARNGHGLLQRQWYHRQVPRPVVRLTDPEYLFVLQVSNAAGCVGTDSVYKSIERARLLYPNSVYP